jgi:hypothetical protein
VTLLNRLKARMYPGVCTLTVAAGWPPVQPFKVDGAPVANGQTFTIDPSKPDADIKAAVDRIEALEACLTELLRLYDWRNELGRREKEKTIEQWELRNALLTYGRQKKAAWKRARELLTGAIKDEIAKPLL